MSKGKKFDAAQKHFMEREQRFNREVSYLKTLNKEYFEKIKLLEDQIITLQNENNQLKEWIERLLNYTELSKEDIKKICEADKEKASSMNAIASLITPFLKYI